MGTDAGTWGLGLWAQRFWYMGARVIYGYGCWYMGGRVMGTEMLVHGG